MNRRPFLQGLVAGLFSLGSLFGISSRAIAQNERPPARRQQRDTLERPEKYVKQTAETRESPAAPVDPKLDKLLHDWAAATERIKTLQGEHVRWVYDNVFEVDKRAIGRFYYEGPDKGRIDIEAFKIEPNGKPSRKVGKGGQPYKIESATPERWICNGQEIWVIADVEKTVDIVPIPKEAQGVNIMDGPLPFLFGMPPDKAKKRYDMKLLASPDPKRFAMLSVKPRLAQDAANWSQAQVKLDLTTFLPDAVKLQDPAGNLETVYQFTNITINQRQNIFVGIVQGEVFKPRLFGYKRNVMQASPIQDPANPGAGKTVPSVLGLAAADAKTLLQRAGCQVKLVPGEPTKNAEFAQTVYEQTPKAGEPLVPKQVVTITYYDAPKVGSRPRSNQRPRAEE